MIMLHICYKQFSCKTKFAKSAKIAVLEKRPSMVAFDSTRKINIPTRVLSYGLIDRY